MYFIIKITLKANIMKNHHFLGSAKQGKPVMPNSPHHQKEGRRESCTHLPLITYDSTYFPTTSTIKSITIFVKTISPK